MHKRQPFHPGKSKTHMHIPNLRSLLQILLESTEVLPLLGRCLVRAVTELRRSVNPFEVDFLERPPTGVDKHRFAEGDDSLLDTRDGALQHHEVILDLAVSHEATKTMQN